MSVENFRLVIEPGRFGLVGRKLLHIDRGIHVSDRSLIRLLVNLLGRPFVWSPSHLLISYCAAFSCGASFSSPITKNCPNCTKLGLRGSGLAITGQFCLHKLHKMQFIIFHRMHEHNYITVHCQQRMIEKPSWIQKSASMQENIFQSTFC